MKLASLSDMLMLGLTPSPTSLERRIRVMQDRSRAAMGMIALAGTGALGLLLVACATNPPAPRATAPVIAGVASGPDGTLDETDIQLQKAATRFYGDLPAGEAKRQRLLWFVFEHDWAVQRHAIGARDVVEVSDEEMGYSYGKNQPQVRPWSVNASLGKQFPDLEGIGTGRNHANISEFGGGRAAIAGDTVMVFWARYAD